MSEMISLLITVLFYLAGTFFPTEANPTLEDAVGYLLVLADDSNQNGYTIQPGSSHVQQFNSQYERVDASGITGEHGRPRLEEACRGVIESIKFFDDASPLERILMERFGRTQALSVIRILSKPNEQVIRRSKAGQVVLALFKMDKVCKDLSLHSNAQSSNPTLRDAIEYLLAYHEARLTVDQVFMPGVLAEACQAVTDNILNFNRDSEFGEIMLERFRGSQVVTITNILSNPRAHIRPQYASNKVVLALYKMKEVCKVLFRQ